MYQPSPYSKMCLLNKLVSSLLRKIGKAQGKTEPSSQQRAMCLRGTLLNVVCRKRLEDTQIMKLQYLY